MECTFKIFSEFSIILVVKVKVFKSNTTYEHFMN
jgi:hypothetical protein